MTDYFGTFTNHMVYLVGDFPCLTPLGAFSPTLTYPPDRLGFRLWTTECVISVSVSASARAAPVTYPQSLHAVQFLWSLRLCPTRVTLSAYEFTLGPSAFSSPEPPVTRLPHFPSLPAEAPCLLALPPRARPAFARRS